MDGVYGEPVHVQARDDGRPVRFVWHGRLYTVRAILEHWVVNREWWRDPPAEPAAQSQQGERGKRGERGERRERDHQRGERGHRRAERGQRGQRVQPELEFWRVEAAPGLSLPTGVYELRRDPAVGNWILR